MTPNDLMHPLHLLGLERERSVGEKVIYALGFFALGTLAGAALGLLTAPKEGKKLREDIYGKTTGMLFSGKQTLSNGHVKNGTSKPKADQDPYSISS